MASAAADLDSDTDDLRRQDLHPAGPVSMESEEPVHLPSVEERLQCLEKHQASLDADMRFWGNRVRDVAEGLRRAKGANSLLQDQLGRVADLLGDLQMRMVQHLGEQVQEAAPPTPDASGGPSSTSPGTRSSLELALAALTSEVGDLQAAHKGHSTVLSAHTAALDSLQAEIASLRAPPGRGSSAISDA